GRAAPGPVYLHQVFALNREFTHGLFNRAQTPAAVWTSRKTYGFLMGPALQAGNQWRAFTVSVPSKFRRIVCLASPEVKKLAAGGAARNPPRRHEDAKKSDFKNFALFASSRWIFWVAAGLHCVHLWFHFVFAS